MNAFNPLMYWTQWFSDQMDDDDEDGAALRGLSLRMNLSSQIALLESYQAVVQATTAGENVKASNEAVQTMARTLWKVFRKQEPAATRAHLQMLRTVIATMQAELKRLGRKKAAAGTKKRT